MSSRYKKNSNVVSSSVYQPISAIMESSDIAAAERIAPTDSEDNTNLPSTRSSQRLMATSETESFQPQRSDAPFLENIARLVREPAQRLAHAGHSKWFTVGILCFVNLINYMDRFTLAGVLDSIQDDFQIEDDSAGLLQTVFVFAYMIFAPVFGYLGDRYSRRWNMVVAVLLWSTTTLAGSYMRHFGWFIAFRAFVGIGEASYSTIAPTIISDLFVGDLRSKMLAIFYFAIPVGSGFGYIVGSEMARITGNWRYALRVTPVLGLVAVVLLSFIKDPKRGESEGAENVQTTTYKEDLRELVKNRSYILTTAAFTCVSFVAGALAWWAPKFIYMGMRLQPGNENLTLYDVSFKFGAITTVAGILGVPLGSYMSQSLSKRIPTADPLVCAFGLLISAPLLTGAIIIVSNRTIPTYILIFFGQLALNLNWAIVADMLLYVVVPSRRGTAEAFQILIAHALGDAGSPYFIGVLSGYMKNHFRTVQPAITKAVGNINTLEAFSLTLAENLNNTAVTASPESYHLLAKSLNQDVNLNAFKSLQYALFSTSFVEVIGGALFLLAAPHIIQDKNNATRESMGVSTAPTTTTPLRPGQRVNIDID